METQRSSGTGPGVFAPDGCSVELYSRIAARGEPELVHAAIPAGASVLELGCGAGRVAAPLARLGHRVVGVDESAEMLDRARDRGFETVHGAIESLELGERFDVVLFGSHLINVEDVQARSLFLATCRRHVADDGMVVIQRYRRGWLSEAEEFDRPSRDGALRTSLRILGRPEPGVLHGRMTYVLDGSTWQHEFTEREVDDEALPELLAQAGLRLLRYLTDDGSWLAAAPIKPSAAD